MTVYKKTDECNEWQRVVNWVTTNDNEWQWMKTSNNEWQQVTKNDNEWQRMTASDKANVKRIRVRKIEWFYVSKWNKRFLNNFIQFFMQYITTIRSSRSQIFFEIGVFKICNIHRKTCNFIKKRLQHRCSSVNIAKFLRKFYLQNTTGGCFCTLNSCGIWWHV